MASDAGDRLMALLRRLFPRIGLLRDDQTARLMAVGIAIGAAGGVSTAALDTMIQLIGRALLGQEDPSVGGLKAWQAALGPVIGGLLAGLVIRVGTTGGRPSGIADVIDATWNRAGKLSLRDGAASALGAALVVGGGQSGGREGPVVQFASAVASRLCRALKIPPARARVLVAAGAAAGIAASFNTPLGAAFFALEIILGNFAMHLFGPVVAAAVTGTVVGQALLGERVAFDLPAFGMRHPGELLLYLALGVFCGLVAVAFKRAMQAAERLFARLPLPPALHPALAGVGVGALAAAGMSPVMGNGYGYAHLILTAPAQVGGGALLLVLVAKIVATALTSASRGGAGIFAPSLFLGAVAGAAFGKLVNAWWPAVVESPGAYGMVGMGAVAAAVAHAPITMALMLFEMTGNYAIILPLLLALAVAGLVDRALGLESEYLARLRRRGSPVERHREELVMYDLRVQDLMREGEPATVSLAAPFEALAVLLLQRRAGAVYVLDESGRYQGVITLDAAAPLLVQSDGDRRVRDVEIQPAPALRPEQPIAEVLSLFFRSDLDELPVAGADGRLIGALRERDVVGAYHREVLRQDALLARVQRRGPEGGVQTDFFELPPGQVLRGVLVAGPLAGRTLRDLELPQRYGCTALALIGRDPQSGREVRIAPDADRILQPGETLVVLGPAESVRALAAGEPAP